MGATNLTYSLTKRYAGLSGDAVTLRRRITEAERLHSTLPELRAELAKMEDELLHIAAVLNGIDPEWDPKSVQPLQRHAYRLPFPYGTCTVLAYDILREAKRWLSLRDVVLKMFSDVDIKPDPPLYARTEANVYAGFRKKAQRGEIEWLRESIPQKWRVPPASRADIKRRDV